MTSPQQSLLSDLQTLFPETIWTWVIPALRQDAVIWSELQDTAYRTEVLRSVGENPQLWTPARLGMVALNRELPSRLTWPVGQLPPVLQSKAAQCYQNYLQNQSLRGGISKAFLLALALLEKYRQSPSWKESLAPCQPLPAWKTALACLFNLTDSRQEFLSVLPVTLGIHVFLATPRPPGKAKTMLVKFLGMLPLEKQVTWLQTLADARPDLTSQVAASLAEREPSPHAHATTLSQHAELYRLAQRPQEALELLQQASKKNLSIQTKLSTQLNTNTAQTQADPHQTPAWKEVIKAARTPSGLEEHAGEIVILMETLLEKEFINAAKTLVENIAAPYPEHPALLTAIAKLALIRGQGERAEKTATRALDSLIQNSPAPPALSEILLDLNLVQESVTAAQHTLSAHPSHQETLRTLAKAQNALENYPEAAENAHIALLLDPGRIDLRRTYAKYLENAQDWDSALKEREQVLKMAHGGENAKSAGDGSPSPIGDQRALAGCALKAGQAGRAAQVCQEILHTSPRDGEAHAILGKSLAVLGNPPEAVEHLTTVTESAPHLTDPWLALAEIHREDGKTAKAIRALQTGANSAERRAEIQLALGELYGAEGEHTQALTAYQTAAKLAETENAPFSLRLETQLHLGQSLRRLGHLEESRQMLKTVTERWPENLPAAQTYGEVLLETGEPQNALPYLEKVVDSEPASAAPYVAYAQANLSLGQGLENAIQALRQAIQLESQREGAESFPGERCLLGKGLALLGDALAAKGNLKSALKAYRRALETNITTDLAWETRISLGLGEVALQLGEVETALAALQDAYQNDPQHLNLAHALAQAYYQANLEAKAKETLQAAFELAPDDLSNLSKIADFAMELGASQLAANALQKIILLEPQRASAYLALGQAQILNGDTEKARVTFFQVHALENPSPETLAETGERLLRQGEIQKATACLERSAQICEDNAPDDTLLPHLWSQLATCYHAEGEDSQALTTLDKAITAQLENPAWRLQKAELLEEMNRYQAALASLNHALDVSPEDPDLRFKAALLSRQVGEVGEALTHAEKSEQGYGSLGQEGTLRRHHALTLAADLACAALQPERAKKLLSMGADEILESLTDTQYALVDGVCLYIELLIAEDAEIEAAQTLTELVSISPYAPRVMALQARLTARQGNVKEGQQAFTEALSAHENQELRDSYAAAAACVALGQAAQELEIWNAAIDLYSRARDLSPHENQARLFLVRAIVLRAEAHRLCEDLQVLHHTPGSESVSATARQTFQEAFRVGEEEDAPPDPRFRTWRLRGEAVFSPTLHSAAALGELPPEAENLAAQISALRHIHNVEMASKIAQKAIPMLQDNPVLAAQTALALEQTEPQMAYQAAQSLKSAQLPAPVVHVLTAITAQGAGDQASAEQAIQEALSYWEDEPRWQALAGEMTDDPQQAISHFEKATKAEPEYPRHHLALGQAYLEAGQPQEAIPALQQVTVVTPEQPQAWIMLGKAYQQIQASEDVGRNGISTRERERLLEKAMECTQQALKLSPQNVTARRQLALFAIEKEAYSDAETHLQTLLKRDPQNAEFLELLAQVLSAQKRPKQALEAIAKAIPLKKSPLPLQLKQAALLQETEGLSEALNALQGLAEEYPNHHDVLFPLANSWAAAGERNKAIQTAQQALRSNHGGPTLNQKANLHTFIGRLLRQSGQLDQAVHHLHQAIQLRPGAGEAYVEMGKTEHKRRKYRKALDVLNQAIDLFPQDTMAYYHAGLALKELNDYAQAERMLRKAAKLAPNDLRIRRQLGVLATLNLVHGEG